MVYGERLSPPVEETGIAAVQRRRIEARMDWEKVKEGLDKAGELESRRLNGTVGVKKLRAGQGCTRVFFHELQKRSDCSREDFGIGVEDEEVIGWRMGS